MRFTIFTIPWIPAKIPREVVSGFRGLDFEFSLPVLPVPVVLATVPAVTCHIFFFFWRKRSIQPLHTDTPTERWNYELGHLLGSSALTIIDMGAGPSVLAASHDEVCSTNAKSCSDPGFGFASLGMGYCRYCPDQKKTADFFFLDGMNTSCCAACAFIQEPRLRASRRAARYHGASPREGLTLLSMFEHFRMVSYCGCGCNQSKSCAICHDNFAHEADLLMLPCGHVFCKGCTVRWMMNQRSCKRQFPHYSCTHYYDSSDRQFGSSLLSFVLFRSNM